MAYKFQVGSATLSGSLVQEGEIKIQNESAVEHAKLTQAGVVSGSGEAAFGSIKLGGTAVTATAAELNYLDNSDLTAADITKLAALTATAAEINYLDNDDLTAADITKLAALTATAAEINYLDNDDLTAADITKLAALTATAAEINYLDLTNAIGTVGAGEAVVVDSDKDVSGFRNVTATGAFIIGSANLNEADMEQIDGITAGTVAASKAVVVDSNKDISGLRNVTATGYFEIGSAQLTESEMEMLDGITAGTVAASKAVVVDASKDISGLNDVSAAGLTLSDLTSGRLPLVSTSGLLADNAQFSYDVGRNLNGFNNIAVSSSASGSGYLGDGLLFIAGADANDVFLASSQGIGMGYDSTLASGEGDNVFSFSPADGEIKWQYDGTSMYFGKDSDVELMHVADTGLRLNSSRQLQFGDSGTYIHQSADGVLDLVSDTEIEINATTIDVNGALDVSGNSVLGGTLTAASLGTSTVDLTADLMIINDGAGGVIKNTSLADYATALAAGSNEGLKSTAGRLQVDLIDLSDAGVNVATDQFAFIDADGSDATKRESIADLVAAMAGAGLNASNGQLSTQAGSVAVVADGSTLAEGYNYLADISSNATVSLPASPSVGDVVHVKAADLNSGANVIIQKQGSHTIDDDHTAVRIESSFGAVSLVYVVSNKWRLV